MEEIFGLIDRNNFYVSLSENSGRTSKAFPVIVLSNNDGCAVARPSDHVEYEFASIWVDSSSFYTFVAPRDARAFLGLILRGSCDYIVIMRKTWTSFFGMTVLLWLVAHSLAVFPFLCRIRLGLEE
jgi:hypothetical protein